MTEAQPSIREYGSQSSNAPTTKRRKSTQLSELFQNNSLGFAGGGIILTAIALQSPAVATALTAIAVMLFLVGDQISRAGKAFSKIGLHWQVVIIGFGILLFLFDTSLVPAQAQFFKAAETWITANFGKAGAGGAAIGTEAVALVFNVLRALFLIYLGISLVRVVNSVRQDEDWQTIARTPLLILVTVFVADVMTTLIVGAGAGG
jgi:hypothetical protein